jgi:hypothetical protein
MPKKPTSPTPIPKGYAVSSHTHADTRPNITTASLDDR